MRAPIELKGFNNLTKGLSFNLYDFAIARNEAERRSYLEFLHASFAGEKITAILREIAEIIAAEVLSVSDQDYDPYGASSLVLMSDAAKVSVAAHLDKSHLCAHTYPDVDDPRGICTFRVDIDVSTCGTIVPLRALDYMLSSFENDVVMIDYVVRGFTRDREGRRVFVDHAVSSIRDWIAPELLADYQCEDLALPAHAIWQTKMLRTKLDESRYFAPGVDPHTPENRELLDLVRREMWGVYHGLAT
ncbi:S-adenosylmethionine decarboxylase [Nannocystaceae bacterium ST9]